MSMAHELKCWALTDEAHHLGGAIASIKAAHLRAGLPKNGIVSSNLHSRANGSVRNPAHPAADHPETVKRHCISADWPDGTKS